MPELPDVTVYLEALDVLIRGTTLQRVEIAGPFLLRTVEPSPHAAAGRKVVELRRIGKRIAISFEGDLWLVLHLMIAGRLHWSEKYKKPDGRRTLAVFMFDNGYLTLTESGSHKRSSLHVLDGKRLDDIDPGGIDIFAASREEFTRVLTRENHTLKRTLTDPRVFSGIGNAYSDEILHRAGLSPVLLTSRIAPPQIEVLRSATLVILREWIERLREQAAGKFPEHVTAFRPEMAVHGRFGQPCPRCGAKIQRIRYAENETNYCAQCQTGGKLLADRGLSRLLRQDWPKTLEELEQRHAALQEPAKISVVGS